MVLKSLIKKRKKVLLKYMLKKLLQVFQKVTIPFYFHVQDIMVLYLGSLLDAALAEKQRSCPRVISPLCQRGWRCQLESKVRTGCQEKGVWLHL